jgi:L-lactate dehydrogenase complex protein LldF
VRIDIPYLLVQQRAAAVAAHTRPTGQDIAMHAAAIAMTTPGRFKLAERALGVGRVLAGRKGRISTLPWPLSGCTNARDLPAPPAETFRQWWSRTHGAQQR